MEGTWEETSNVEYGHLAGWEDGTDWEFWNMLPDLRAG